MKEAAELIAVMRAKTPLQVARLMDLSDELAALNVARYAAWSTRNTAGNSRPAVLAFAGDVYEGLQAETLTLDELAWAQQHLVILSGLYGQLRRSTSCSPTAWRWARPWPPNAGATSTTSGRPHRRASEPPAARRACRRRSSTSPRRNIRARRCARR